MPEPSTAKRAAGLVPWLALGFFGVRLLAFVRAEAVNLVFRDQWEYLKPLFDGVGLWDRFSYQYGPHRMGLGYLLTSAIYSLTRWDGWIEAVAVGVLMAAVAAAALLLARRVRGASHPADGLLAILALSTTHFELFVGTVNPAHGALPVLTVLLFALLAMQPDSPGRLAGLLAVQFGAVFTGFGVLLGPVAIGVFLVEALCATGRSRVVPAAALIASAATLALYFRGYVFTPTVPCFKLPIDRPADYFSFGALLALRPMRAYYPTGIVRFGGGLLLAGMTVAAILPLLHAARPRAWGPADRAIFVTTSFSLSFVGATAIGRACQGPEFAASSRYVVYLVPGIVGLFLSVIRSPLVQRAGPRMGILGGLALVAVAVLELRGSPEDDRWIRYFHDGKEAFVECYLRTEDLGGCERDTGFAVYESPDAEIVRNGLETLKREHLNLFNGR